MGEERSEHFCMGRGVKQGCPLSPGLFNLLTADLEKEMRKGGWGGVRLKGGEGVHAGVCRRYGVVGRGEGGYEGDDVETKKICKGERAGGKCGEV